jgi:copper transport protein
LIVNALLQALSGGIALAWLLVALPAPAHGHAVVLETIPADGTVLESAPDQVVIRFNEPVAPVAAQILNAAGEEITPAEPVRVEGAELRIVLPPSLAEGSYVASYRVISADSHPVGGSIVFSVGTVSERVTAPRAAAGDRGWTAAMVVVRAILYAGILAGAGGVLFLLLVRPTDLAGRVTASIAATLAGAGSFAAVLAIGIQGGLLMGGPVASLVDADTWRLGLTSGFGTTAVVALSGLALVAVGLRLDRPAILRPLAYLGAAAALTSFALSGHIVTAGPRWFTVPVLIAHTTAVAFWVGALLPLHEAVGRLRKGSAPIVTQFSRVAVRAVAVLVAAGLIIVVLQVRGIRGLIGTTYGLILLGKLALVAGLLTLAAINKLRLTPSLGRGEPGAARALRRTIAAEIGLALSILVVTAVLGTMPPPRVLEGGAESHAGHMIEAHGQVAGLSVTMVSSGGSAEIVFDSAQSGINSLQIQLLDSAGAPIGTNEVTLVAANPSAGVEPIRRAAEATRPGTWRIRDILLVPAGRWSIRVDALVSDFEKAIFETVITLH